MFKVKIYGAGSIGNHLAHACRRKGWDVLICDIDPEALNRTRTSIYPDRYGAWDESIKLCTLKDAPQMDYDLEIIGTPPDSHVSLAIDILKKDHKPRTLLIEKPVCTPSLEGANELYQLSGSSDTDVFVGYNHTLTENTKRVTSQISRKILGTPLTISSNFREHWGGIFSAHPWLDGPQDTYLGYLNRGGGASGEHSHAINIWQHFAHVCDMGKITEVSAMLDMVDDGIVKYDRICLVNVKTEKGKVGTIIQDVITKPPRKELHIQGTKGFIEWIVSLDGKHDAVHYKNGDSEVIRELIPKTRPKDFENEIDHIEQFLKEQAVLDSPISLEKGLDTMLVIAAIQKSFLKKCTATINYSKGYCLEAIKTIV